MASLIFLTSTKETTVYRIIKPATRTVEPRGFLTHTDIIVKEVVETEPEWIDTAVRTATAVDTDTRAMAYGLKPAFSGGVASRAVEDSAVVTVAEEEMSYLGLLEVFLLVFGVVVVVHVMADRLCRNSRPSGTEKDERIDNVQSRRK